MLGYIWLAMIAGGFICALFTGRMTELCASVGDGADKAVKLLLNMAGVMCLWSGIMKIADKSGISAFIARLLSPLLRLIMPDCKKDSPELYAVSANITANLLGLGNAATPLGILAMKKMQASNRLGDRPNDSMVMFVVINTASIQLIPVTAAALRKAAGSTEPYSIMPLVWISSLIALAAGIGTAILLSKGRRTHRKQ